MRALLCRAATLQWYIDSNKIKVFWVRIDHKLKCLPLLKTVLRGVKPPSWKRAARKAQQKNVGCGRDTVSAKGT